MVLIEAVRGGKSMDQVEGHRLLYTKNRACYTDEIYGYLWILRKRREQYGRKIIFVRDPYR